MPNGLCRPITCRDRAGSKQLPPAAHARSFTYRVRHDAAEVCCTMPGLSAVVSDVFVYMLTLILRISSALLAVNLKGLRNDHGPGMPCWCISASASLGASVR